MRYQYDVRHDSAQWRLEELHADAAREHLWRSAVPSGDHWPHPLKLLRALRIRH